MTKVFKNLPRNKKGRDFVVGDIHGAYGLLEKALKDLGFDPDRDRLISVGDLVDRGPASARCLEFLSQDWFHAVRGNHEDMIISLIDKNGEVSGPVEPLHRNGMGWLFDLSAPQRLALKAAFKKLPIAMQTKTRRGTVGFVHANVPQGLSWPDFVKELEKGNPEIINLALWDRSRAKMHDTSRVKGIGRVFLGHTVQIAVAERGNCYFIDTGAVFNVIGSDKNGHITVADISVKTAFLKKARPPQGNINLVTGKRHKKPRRPHPPTR